MSTSGTPGSYKYKGGSSVGSLTILTLVLDLGRLTVEKGRVTNGKGRVTRTMGRSNTECHLVDLLISLNEYRNNRDSR